MSGSDSVCSHSIRFHRRFELHATCEVCFSHRHAVGRDGRRWLPRPLDLSSGQFRSLTDILEADNPVETVQFLRDPTAQAFPIDKCALLPPVDNQEIWAAGVTYKRSKVARIEESVAAASVYDRVYEAARPELFFKSMPQRVVGMNQPVRIRRDSKWNVPEPELTLVISSRLSLVGFTIGNDMSSRDIEGENPLYLPQAKVYNQSCAIGPWITLASYMPARATIGIRMAIVRGGQIAFEGKTSVDQLARELEDLIAWLGRDKHVPRWSHAPHRHGHRSRQQFHAVPGRHREHHDRRHRARWSTRSSKASDVPVFNRHHAHDARDCCPDRTVVPGRRLGGVASGGRRRGRCRLLWSLEFQRPASRDQFHAR